MIAHNRDFAGLDDYLVGLERLGVDAIIISDPGILSRARTVVPKLPIHLSTQANVTNRFAAAFWIAQGAGRLNLARELGVNRAGVDIILRMRRRFEALQREAEQMMDYLDKDIKNAFRKRKPVWMPCVPCPPLF